MLDWSGGVTVCIASGPSLTAEDCETVRLWQQAQERRHVITINTSFKLSLFADVLYACDFGWWNHYHGEVSRGFKGECWTASKHAATKYGLNLIEVEEGGGIGRDKLRHGSNSGYQAINLAYLFGSRRIILLGYDMQRAGGKSHWFGEHPKGLQRNSEYATWILNYGPLARELKAEGAEVINASRNTALNCFNRMSLEDALWTSA